MPVKRALSMEDAQSSTPSKKRPAPDRNYSPMTGTASLPEAERTTATTQKPPVLQTQTERLRSLSSKLEGSAEAFIKAQTELQEILVSVDGSGELRRFLSCGSGADWSSELRRHTELMSRAESCVKGSDPPQNSCQGAERTGSSYEFLKSIMGSGLDS